MPVQEAFFDDLLTGPAVDLLGDDAKWVYRRKAGGDSVSVRVVYREDALDLNVESPMDAVTVCSTTPLATVRVADLGFDPRKDDRIAGRGRKFVIRDVKMPGDGSADLYLFEE